MFKKLHKMIFLRTYKIDKQGFLLTVNFEGSVSLTASTTSLSSSSYYSETSTASQFRTLPPTNEGDYLHAAFFLFICQNWLKRTNSLVESLHKCRKNSYVEIFNFFS
jgi:hypothetical protein